MTAEELIEELSEIKDKSKDVKFLNSSNQKEDVNCVSSEKETYVLLT